MVDRIRYRWSAAGITDEDETLITRLRRSGMLLIPQSVEIDYGEETCIVYPLPRFVDSPVASGANMQQFLFEGWDMVPLAGAETSTILEEFLKLIEAPAFQVKLFVEKWGPLWVCDKHGREHHKCPSPSFVFDSRFASECSWTPRERVADFKIAAREVRSILSISASLMRGELGRAEDWAAVGATGLDLGTIRERESDINTVSTDRFYLAEVICDRLSFYGPPLSFDWAGGEDRPTLAVNAGFGFLRLVWLQAAQCITGARDIYTCDGCGTVYIRDSERRRPKVGCRNYCERCADTARKRDWARRNKKKQDVS